MRPADSMEKPFHQMMVDPTLAEMGKNLNEAMKILEDGQREAEEDKAKRKYGRKDIPGPLQGSGQDVANILQLVQNLMYGEEEEDSQSHRRVQNVGEQGHLALLGHSLAAYISVLDKERLRKMTTRILSDTTLWLCRLFRYENGSAYYHEDDRDGLLKVCRLVIHSRYEDFTIEGFNVLNHRRPVIYQSTACRLGLGQHLCNQLGLPLSCLCTVPCNTMFGSQHQMDVALLDRLIKEDVDSGKLPLLLVANAGTPGAGHTDKLGRLKELCSQYNMWLHVEGVNLAMLALGYVSSSVMAATKCDSMTLTLGPWLGLPAVPAVTLYRHEDPALSLAAGLTSSQPVEKLRALPLWLSLQYLGHDGIVDQIRHASQLSQRLLDQLKNVTSVKTSVEDVLSSPVVVFRFTPEVVGAGPSEAALEVFASSERELQDTLNRWLGEQLARLVPASGVDVVELEDEGSCVRFSPLMTSAVLGTKVEDVDMLVERLRETIPVLYSTLRMREEFKREVYQTSTLTYIEDLNWPGLGAIRYELCSDEADLSKRQLEVEKTNGALLKKLKELDSDLLFSTGPEFGPEKNCIYVGMATEDLDVAELVETISTTGREIEENSKLLENMTEVVRKGILEAELQLQKANEEKLLEEGVLRQIPVVGSVLNWFSPVQSSIKGRTFNLAAGSLDSTEQTYTMKAQSARGTPPPTPTSSRTKRRMPGEKLFRRSRPSGDAVSETSSIGHPEELDKEVDLQDGTLAREDVPEQQEMQLESPQREDPSDERTPSEGSEQTQVEGKTESVDSLR
ncbi:pyridoxal-dependent decarboxylase domain-containing protein 1 isoform X1 [Erpetoichthys calabaricus]|uniref:Pyridoxal-dependent decarboxylase domain-containing protein 1 n=2 Tax=Erpetoichthys calabaricus TaxID=27687 RepID=A0A8C4SYU0_ERPCA|nr:pyridoxal-dependent decarboxylase domain-containing protein 1 isoform X1 [Erpetoichthys calabaricus]